MSTDIAEIEARIRSLSHEDKTELIRALIADLDGPAEADVDRAWLAGAQRRYRELVEGKVQPVPGERVFGNLRSRLKKNTDRREVLEELLRRAAELPYAFPSDDELVRAADQVFQDLDRREARG
jgi:hypothetical protein